MKERSRGVKRPADTGTKVGGQRRHMKNPLGDVNKPNLNVMCVYLLVCVTPRAEPSVDCLG